jgi:RNA polymerase sigma-70 factor (ECF subfamily)
MDEAYIRSVLNGDIPAFRYLVNKYKDRAFNLSKSIVRSDLDAEEATQDAFVQAYRNLSKFKARSKFSTWFYRILINESLKKIKKKKLQYIPIDEVVLNEPVPDLSVEAVEHLHEEEQRELINEILDKLKGSETLLLKLYYLEEKKIDEITEITGLTQSNCKVILFRARKNFAEMYLIKVNQEQMYDGS